MRRKVTRPRSPSTATAPTGRPGARAQRKAETREAILEAARRALRRHGFAGTTTRVVAREAGVAVGTVFLHFPDTSALVEALLDRHLEAALEDAYRTLPRRGDLVKRLLHVARRLYDSYDVEPALSRAFLAGSLFPPEAEGEGVGEASTGSAAMRLRAFEAWVLEEVAHAVETREIRAIAPAVAFTAFFSIYFGLLVAGLRRTVSRREQMGLLDAALRRLFGLEDGT